MPLPNTFISHRLWNIAQYRHRWSCAIASNRRRRYNFEILSFFRLRTSFLLIDIYPRSAVCEQSKRKPKKLRERKNLALSSSWMHNFARRQWSITLLPHSNRQVNRKILWHFLGNSFCFIFFAVSRCDGALFFIYTEYPATYNNAMHIAHWGTSFFVLRWTMTETEHRQ